MIANSTNPDGSKKYPLTLRLESFVTKILFNTTGENSKTPQATGVEFLAGQSMFSADPRFNASIKGTGADGPFDCRTHRAPTY